MQRLTHVAGQHRVVIVDPHPIFREGIARLAAETEDLEVVGAAGSRREAEAMVARYSPDLLVTAVDIGGEDGVELVSWVRQVKPQTGTLVLLDKDLVRSGERALRAGATAHLPKSVGTQDLLDAMREVLSRRSRGEQVVRGATGIRWGGRGDDPAFFLSARELDIFRRIGEGETPKDIAADLGLSVKTVASHRANIQAKLGVRGVAELLRRAVIWNEQRRSGSGLGGGEDSFVG
jgi:DNA-binding NarL/FixJ family response regulator